MIKYALISVFFFIALSYDAVQEKCEVLKPEIALEYDGECRRGLAHGYGKATGADTYEGNFRNGLPHGEGIYTRSTGEVYEGGWRRGLQHGRGKYTYFEDGEEMVKTGRWVNGEFSSRAVIQAEYKINRQRSINDIRVISTGEGSNVVLKITRSGLPLTYSNLNVSGSSGQQRMQGQEIRFEHVNFPFTASARYRVPNVMRTAEFDCELEITIVTPGSWEIVTNQ